MKRLVSNLSALQLKSLFTYNGLEKSSQFIPVLSVVHRTFSSSPSGYDDKSDGSSDERQEMRRPSERFYGPRDRADYGSHRRGSIAHFRNEDSYSDRRFNDRYEKKDLGSRLETRNWNASELDSFEKNFYVSHPSVSERTQEDIDGFYEKHSITVTRGERPTPVFHFQEANFPEHINHRLKATGWNEPTPIQSMGWPLALSGKNLVGIAQTGSGKTLGFLLPAMVHIRHQRPVKKEESVVLVLAPTRELAQQIQAVSHQFSRPMGIRSRCIFGGQSKLIQAKQLFRGQEILVATPGRLIDFIEDGIINLDRTTYVVLDEADRMLDMGFEPQIRKILGQIRPDRQILMWSATWPKEIQSLAHDFLEDFTQVNIGSTELTVNPNIDQIFRVCDEMEKFFNLQNELISIFKRSEDPRQVKILVFANTQMRTEIIARKLRSKRLNAREIHGKKTQSYRESVLEDFRNGHLNILVATDVAARGLDVDDIQAVVNYDLPNCLDDYIHRIGRTARASKTGTAISFCTEESMIVPDLVSHLEASNKEINHELQQLAMLQSKYGKNRYASQRRGNYKGFQRPDGRRPMPRYSGGYDERRGFSERNQRTGPYRKDKDSDIDDMFF